MTAALRAAGAGEATRRAAARHVGALSSRRIRLLAAGKAAMPMARAFVKIAGAQVVDGLVVSRLTEGAPPGLRALAAAHPVPDERSEQAGRAALELAARVSADEVFVVLLSGGASSLLAVPAPGLSLADKRNVTARLLARGADITALNTVRKHLSGLKGGRLAAACRGDLLAWVLSDVVGDDVSVIASGPTVPDVTTLADARAILDRFGGVHEYPAAVAQHLHRTDAPAETPKPGDGVFARASTSVIGSARLSLEGAALAARERGYRVVMRQAPVVGEVREAAELYGDWLASLADERVPICALSFGETTVSVRGPGRGGRNQEFALALVPRLPPLGSPITVASVGTDGIDGPTDAAGAWVDETTLTRAQARGLEWRAALDANDSWTFFHSLGDLIVTGPTDTNVGDVQAALISARRS